MKISDIFIPCIITFILILGIIKKVDIASEFAYGAREGLKTAFEILPSLILIMTGIGMFTRSGAVEIISCVMSPITNFLGFPKQCVNLAIIRPFSGSGALATLDNVLSDLPPDSFSARVASVLMGSTETTFYTISMYFSSIKRKAVPSVFTGACFADICGFVLSALIVRLYYG